MFKEELIKRLLAYRKENKLSQEEMAKKVKISRSYYADVENGRYLPSGKVISRISEVLNFF